MGAYKQFLASDIIITPFEVNKGFTFTGASELTGSDVGIDRFLGQNITSSIFNPLSDPTTGEITTQYQRLIYNSIEELYYSNYLSSSYGDPVSRAILIPGRNEEGNRLIGSSSNQAYDNYLQSTLSYPRFFPTASNCYIGVISIPSKLFGDYIQPNSFILTSESGSLTDDGEGNIISGSRIVGNIIYPHGLILITGDTSSYNSVYLYSSYGTASYGSGIYGQDIIPFETGSLLNFISSPNVTCSFSSSFKIQESQYKCVIRENEFNFSLNPTLLSGSRGDVYGYVSSSYFSPYITTIGLYDEQQNLLAVGKLAQPLPSSPTTDTTIVISLDR